MVIRQARLDEVPKLQNLKNEVFNENQNYDPDLEIDWAKTVKGKEYFTTLLNTPDAICLISEENGKFIAYATGKPKIFPYRNSRYFEIEYMGVIPQYRSKGICSRLMQKCIEWAKEKGFQKLFINSYFKNSKAIKFYKKKGFSEIDISLERAI